MELEMVETENGDKDGEGRETINGASTGHQAVTAALHTLTSSSPMSSIRNLGLREVK